jgi:hypothetical protein
MSVSDITVSDILDSDHLPILYYILDHVIIRNLSEPVEKFSDWERFQSLEHQINLTVSPLKGLKLQCSKMGV